RTPPRGHHMKSRILFAAAAALAIGAFAPSSAAAQCFGPTAYADNSGAPISGCGNDINIGGSFQVSYAGSSAGFWHSLWVFSPSDLIGLNPSSPLIPGTTGDLLFCKVAGCLANSGNPGTQAPINVAWTPGTAIFGLYVLPEGTPDGDGYVPGGYWIFSGSPTYNPDGQAHAAYFTDKIFRDDGTTVLATNTASFLLGFEDKCESDIRNEAGALTCSGGTDWDFNDAVFSFDVTGTPTEIVPEPATMTLLATGLVGMAAARRRRKNG
ncbi:MAG TPA: PEP-CTERM sorting domain-containing protein, partial [Gemmatimonadales bacterium]|nr:PEP-CTERM sorting domain-containing protein [Gemmatimonadales bacterium]